MTSGKIDVRWYDETKRVIHLTYTGAWTLADYRQAEIDAQTLLMDVKNNVCVLADLSQSTAIPQGGLLRIAKAYVDAPPNLDITLIVGADWLHEAILTAVGRITPPEVSTLYFVNTLEEAITFLERYLTGDNENNKTANS